MTARTSISLHLTQSPLRRKDLDCHAVQEIVPLAYEYADAIMEREIDLIEALETLHQHSAFTDAAQHAEPHNPPTRADWQGPLQPGHDIPYGR